MDIRDIATCARLACLLEVSAPKPGNVNRLHDFENTTFEDFLASGIALGDVCEEAARKGFDVGKGEITMEDAGLGGLIKRAVEESRKWHSGKNTNLGMAMLLIPLSAAAGYSLAEKGRVENHFMRQAADQLLRRSTTNDTIALYEAINMAGAGGMGTKDKLDIKDENARESIEKDNVNLFNIMELTENDSIADELTGSYRINFEIGYKAIMSHYKATGSLRDSILFAYMKILSGIPDTLIARKCGTEKAEEVSGMALDVLDSDMDEARLEDLDSFLRSDGNNLNPGTSADLVCSSLFIALLNGVRP